MKKRKVLYFFLLYTLIFTLPVIIFFFSRIPGEFSDTFQVWGKTLEFQNFIGDNGILKTLIFQIKNGRFTWPEIIPWFQYFTNDFVGYNIIWLGSFLLAAYGMYLLVFYLTKNKFSAFISGIIFSFSPFHISQAISTNIGTMHYEWLPFFVLFYIKFLRKFNIKDFLFSGLFLVLITFSENQLLAFMFPFVIILTIAYLVKNSEKMLDWKLWAYVGIGVIIFFFFLRILFNDLFKIAESEDNYLDAGKEQVINYSSDAIDLLIPQRFHPVWGEPLNYLRKDTQSNSMGRKSTYIGYTVLFLSLISLLGYRKRFLIKLFLVFGGILFAAMSLGPVFTWMGQVYPKVEMPYSILYENIKYWQNIRTVSRIFIISIMCFSVSAGFGIQFILRKLNKNTEKNETELRKKGQKYNKEKVQEQKNPIKLIGRKMIRFKNLVIKFDWKKIFIKLKEIKNYKIFLSQFKKDLIIYLQEQKVIFKNNTAVFLKKSKKIWKKIFTKKKKNKKKVTIGGIISKMSPKAITIFFLLFITLEYLSFPIPLMKMEYSKFYDILRQDKGNYAILDILASTSYDYASKSLIYNQIHRKTNYAGMDFARVIQDHWDFQSNTPVISDLLYTLPEGSTPPGKEIINDYYMSLGTKILNFYNIQYIIVDKQQAFNENRSFSVEDFNKTIDYINNELDATKVYEDKFLIAFKVEKSSHVDGWFLAMDLKKSYWDKKGGDGESIARWAKNGAKLRLVNLGKEPQNLRLLFDTKIKNLRTLRIYLNNELQFETHIKEERESHVANLTNIKPGTNEIRFEILDINEKPVDTFEFGRGVRFSNLRTINARDK